MSRGSRRGCPACGALNYPTDSACLSCGAELRASQAGEEAPPPADSAPISPRLNPVKPSLRDRIRDRWPWSQSDEGWLAWYLILTALAWGLDFGLRGTRYRELRHVLDWVCLVLAVALVAFFLYVVADQLVWEVRHRNELRPTRAAGEPSPARRPPLSFAAWARGPRGRTAAVWGASVAGILLLAGVLAKVAPTGPPGRYGFGESMAVWLLVLANVAWWVYVGIRLHKSETFLGHLGCIVWWVLTIIGLIVAVKVYIALRLMGDLM